MVFSASLIGSSAFATGIVLMSIVNVSTRHSNALSTRFPLNFRKFFMRRFLLRSICSLLMQ